MTIFWIGKRDLSPITQPGMIMVYLPMSYQIGGCIALVPHASVRPVDKSFEEAMRFTPDRGS